MTAVPPPTMETSRDVLTALAWRYAFGDLAALTLATAAADHPDRGDADPGDAAAGGAHRARAVDIATVRALCAFGQGLLDLDAEDFGDFSPGHPPHSPHAAHRAGHSGRPDQAAPAGLGTVPPDLLRRALASRMPQHPKEPTRGALRSLRPAYALLLEVIDARWRRREMAALVAVVHIAAEYLPLLAWEPVLGHAADPALLPRVVTGPGSLFGTRADRECAHNRAEQSAAHRALGAAEEPGPGWRAYLDRQHSHVARALGVCVARCRRPCAMPERLDRAVRADLTERCAIALDFGESALVRLRHAAPVGHGFGVPSPDEVQEAWQRTRASLSKHPLARAAFADADAEATGRRGRRTGSCRFPLPGLPALFSAVAGATIVPDTLLRDVAERIAAALEAGEPRSRRPARPQDAADAQPALTGN